MDVDLFRDKYLDQDWIVVKGAPDRFESLVPWSELNTVLQRLRMPKQGDRVRLVKNGKEISRDTYLRNSGRGAVIRTGAFERQLADGATLVLNGVHELFNGVRELADDADAELGSISWANLYAGWRSQQGFDLHWDDHDTLIVQVYGRKQWTVYAPTCDHPTKGFSGSWEKPTDPPVWEGILEAGSLLYMPRGWWHFAVPLDEPTLHVTLGLQALTGEEVLKWLNTQLQSVPIFRGNLPTGRRPGSQQRYIAQLRDEIARALTDDTVERVRALARAEVPFFPLPNLPDAVVPEPSIRPSSILFLSGARELDLNPLPDGRLSLAFGGDHMTCSAELAGPLSRLSGANGVRFSELSGALPFGPQLELKIVLAAMLRKGVLLARSGESARTEQPWSEHSEDAHARGPRPTEEAVVAG
jgi:hypothetical protein